MGYVRYPYLPRPACFVVCFSPHHCLAATVPHEEQWRVRRHVCPGVRNAQRHAKPAGQGSKDNGSEGKYTQDVGTCTSAGGCT